MGQSTQPGVEVFVVQVVVAIGIVLGTVLVAAGRGDGLPAVDVRRRGSPLPSDRLLVAADLDAVRLGVGFRGYRMDEVDEVLDRLKVDLAERDQRIAELERVRAITASSERNARDERNTRDEHIAELERVAELERKAELDRVTELERIAELDRVAEPERVRHPATPGGSAEQTELDG